MFESELQHTFLLLCYPLFFCPALFLFTFCCCVLLFDVLVCNMAVLHIELCRAYEERYHDAPLHITHGMFLILKICRAHIFKSSFLPHHLCHVDGASYNFSGP